MSTQCPTVVEVLADLESGRRRATEVVRACLSRIEATEPEIRAWVTIDRAGAWAAAEAVDRARLAGVPLGPLAGLPIGVKDIVDVAGLPTAAGFTPWADRVAAEDAPLVARFREAGAILLGKAVTTPFAWVDPPPTRNPWHPDRTPGGSSSGSAAAVAAGMVPAAIGSQTGGSVIRPAAFCGVCGLKPSYGALDARGFVPLAPSLDHPGLIARTVTDLAILWGVLSGEPSSAMGEGSPRLGRLRGMFETGADPAMRAVFDRAIEGLRSAGARIAETTLPEGFADVVAMHRRVMAFEAARSHRATFAEFGKSYPPRIRALVEEGAAIPEADYREALGRRDRLIAGMPIAFEGVDALILPATVGPAPDRSTTGDPAFQSPWSYTGLPAVCFPIGRSPDGLPLAAQVVGRAGGESSLLRLAARLAAILPFSAEPRRGDQP